MSYIIELEDKLARKDIDQKFELAKKDIDKKFELNMKDIDKKSELDMKDIELFYKDKELLTLKGLLTVRGIFEFYMHVCSRELQRVGICKSLDKFNVSNILMKMGLKENQEKLPPGGYCASLLSAADQYNVELSNVYMVLCSDVHRSSWSGPGVLVYASKLNVGEKCVVEFIADKMNLRTVEQ